MAQLTPEEYRQAIERGYTDAEIRAKGDEPPKALWGVPGARYLQPGEQAQSMPGPLATIGSNIKQNWPGILGMIPTAFIGGGPVVGPLARSAAMGTVTGAGRALQGDPEALNTGLMAGGSNLASEGILGGALVGLGSVFRSNLGKRMAAGLADYLRANVPALRDVKTLKEMLRSQGPVDAVHAAHDQALKNLAENLRTKNDFPIPKELADRLGIPHKGATDMPTIPEIGRVPVEMVVVNPADAVMATVGKWKKDPGAYSEMNDILDRFGYIDRAANRAYKSWSGIRELMDKTGAIKGNAFNPEKAQAGLSDPQASAGLLRRGMQQDVADILMPNGSLAIERGNYRLPGAGLGAVVGAAAGGPLGLLGHGMGAVGGMYLGSHIGQAIPRYSNVVPPNVAAAKGPLAAGLGNAAANSPLTITPAPSEADARAAQEAVDAEWKARQGEFNGPE